MSGNSKHGKNPSAVLSMPNLFRATELAYESEVSKFATYLVEEKDAEDSDEMLMKSIKNERCVAFTLKYVLDQLRTLEHPNLPRIVYQTHSDNYSYIVFERPSKHLKPINNVFHLLTRNEDLCRSVTYELCRTIQYTHAYGVVHKDLRPNNVHIHIRDGKLKQLMLIDFGATKALQPDQKLAIMEQGSGFITQYVRKAFGQYPAPEILMDLRCDRHCDAWFLGILVYMMLNGGNVPFIGDEDFEIQDNILHSSNNKFSLLQEQLRAKVGGDGAKDSELSHWMEISDDLFDLINGLLTKDAKKRYSVDYVLWSDWIPSTDYAYICNSIVRHWMRTYRIIKHDTKGGMRKTLNRFAGIANNIRQSKHKGSVGWHNNGKSAMHQFKLCNYNGNASYIKSDCYVTLSSNIWCKYDDNPCTIEYVIDFAKYDVYFGILCCNEYEKDVSYYHFLGSDVNSIALSVRYGKAWHNSKEVSDVKRHEYLRQNMKRDGSRGQEADNGTAREDLFSGPPPLRNVKVSMRIDSLSRTLSFKINDIILDPLYFEFPGHVSPAFTLCNCLDQVTIKSLKYDKMENIQLNTEYASKY